MTPFFFFVIPAEAGISGGKGGPSSPEIPASAGMTRGVRT